MNPMVAALAFRALKFVLAGAKLRRSFATTVAVEKMDVSPEVVAALSGDGEAIKKLDAEIDEGWAENKAIQARLAAQVRAQGGQP
jgi:hypothetical protein